MTVIPYGLLVAENQIDTLRPLPAKERITQCCTAASTRPPTSSAR